MTVEKHKDSAAVVLPEQSAVGIRALLREPLLHFLVIGAIFFGVYLAVKEPTDLPGDNEIIVTDFDALRLADRFESTWRRPPTPNELNRLIDEFIREEVYVRQALLLGLDEGDAIVRQRLRQKMEFLSEAASGEPLPDEAALRQHYEENIEAFTPPPLFGFSQILLTDGSAAASVVAELKNGADPNSFGAPSLLPVRIAPTPPVGIDNAFGIGFAEQLAELESGEWSGPVTSGYGTHVVRIDSRSGGDPLPFEEVRPRVEQDLAVQRAEERRIRFIDNLMARYSITRPDPSEVLVQ